MLNQFAVQLYSSAHTAAWNDFISTAKNASFMLLRHFMEYHQSRFDDYSIMIFRNQRLKAVLPAHLLAGSLYSHQGLSYAGIVLSQRATLPETILLMRVLLKFLHQQGIKKIYLKLTPVIYHTRPAEEINWILFRLGASLYRRDALAVIDRYATSLPYQQRRKRAISKAAKLPLQMASGWQELAPFWREVLIPNLQQRHQVAPAHSLEEIQYLARMFPQNIIQHTVYLHGQPVAGCTVFLHPTAAHLQYISANEIGKKSGSLDWLIDYLINQYADRRFFSFGNSNESNGQIINQGLIEWKEGFGASILVQDFYQINTENYPLLDNCLIYK